MAHHLLKSYGIICILVGVSLIGASPYLSYVLSDLSLLTELALGTLMVWFGAHLIAHAKKQSSEKCPEEEDSELGESTPFYYELEPVHTIQRELPPIPKDIGRDYDPVVLDKV